MKRITFWTLILLLSTALIACNDNNTEETIEATNEVLISFQDVNITSLDAENAKLMPDQTIYDAAKSLLFHEIVLVEAEEAGTTYDPEELQILVYQTAELYDFDEEAIAFINEKSELYNIEPEEYIRTIWTDYLRKRVILNNHLSNKIDFAGKSDEEVAVEIANFEEELLLKYEDEIEYHF